MTKYRRTSYGHIHSDDTVGPSQMNLHEPSSMEIFHDVFERMAVNGGHRNAPLTRLSLRWLYALDKQVMYVSACIAFSKQRPNPLLILSLTFLCTRPHSEQRGCET